HYAADLTGAAVLLGERAQTPCIFHLFPIRVTGRDALSVGLAKRGIASGIHYSPAIHRQSAFAEVSSPCVELACAERWAREELSLPISPELREDERDRVIDATL